MEKALRKVDSMESDERERLRALLCEKSNKKSGVDWMYKEDKPEKEEYLLGRKIDRHIEEELAPPEPDKDAPGALFHDVMARRTDLDMQAKKREDPLYAIYQKEEEARKKLLRNPIKMKQLQKVLDEKKKKKEEEDAKARHHRKEKRRHRDKQVTDDLVSRYLDVIGEKEDTRDLEAVRRRLQGDDSEHHSRKDRNREVNETRSDRSQLETDGGRGKTYGLLEPSRGWRRTHREERQKEQAAPSKTSSASRNAPASSKHTQKRKLTAEEMAKKRKEMMANARERDEEREDNVKRYRDEDRGGNSIVSNATSDVDFVKPMMMEHAAQSSVSDRIKRNIYNIQRTKADMSKKFTDRH